MTMVAALVPAGLQAVVWDWQPPVSGDRSFLGLVFGAAADRFVADHFPSRAAVVHGPGERLVDLIGDGRIREVPALLRAGHRDNKATFLVEGVTQTLVFPEATLSERIFRCGATVTLNDVARTFPEARPWIERLAREVGLAPGAVNLNAYVSPAGTGLPAHFDDHETLIVQLAGRKSWRVAPNVDLAHPLVPCMPSIPERARGELERAAAALVPEQMQAIELRAGSAIFLPRGYWHQTRAVEDSISLTFALSVPSGCAVLARLLYHHLEREPAWRAPLAQGAEGVGQIQTMLAALAAELPSLEALPGLSEAVSQVRAAWPRTLR
jgi:hypothetical protein